VEALLDSPKRRVLFAFAKAVGEKAKATERESQTQDKGKEEGKEWRC